MKRTSDQLLEEATYSHLAEFLRSGGSLEVGEALSLGTLARIRKRNRTVTVDAVYRDCAAVLREMDLKAKEFLHNEGNSPT